MTVRDLREAKSLSQVAVSTAMGISESAYQRIESGSAKTTPAEIALATKTIKSMPKSERKLGGRQFKDPAKQAAVAQARELGTSVTEALAAFAPEPKAAPAAAKPKAPAKKAPAKAAPKATATAKAKPKADA